MRDNAVPISHFLPLLVRPRSLISNGPFWQGDSVGERLGELLYAIYVLGLLFDLEPHRACFANKLCARLDAMEIRAAIIGHISCLFHR